MDLFDLCAKLTLDTSEYDSGIASAESSAGGLASAIGGGFAGAMKAGAVAIAGVTTAVAGVTTAFGNAVASTAQYGDEIDKSSQKLGVSASFYQEWDAVLQHSGTSMDSMSATFKKLASASQEASDDQVKAFEAVGLSMEQVSSMSAEDLFSSVVSGLQGMEESTERTALATELLGRGAMELGPLLNTSAEDTQKMIDTVNELGGVMDDASVKASAQFQDSLQDLQTAFSGLQRGVTAEFLPSISGIMDGMSKLISGDASGSDVIKENIQNLADTIEEAMPQIMETIEEVIPLIAEVVKDALPVLLEVGMGIVETLGQGIIENLPNAITYIMDIIPMMMDTLQSMFPALTQSGGQAISAFISGLASLLPEFIPMSIDMILSLVEGLADNIDLIIDGAIQLVTGLATGIVNALPIIVAKAPEIIAKIVIGIINALPQIAEAGLQIITMLGNALIENVPILVSKVPEIINRIVTAFNSVKAKMKAIGKNIVEGIWAGISGAYTWITGKLKEWAGNVLNYLKGVFGIHSPSRVMRDEVGVWLGKGVIEGFVDSKPIETIKSMVNGAFDNMSYAVPISAEMSATAPIEDRYSNLEASINSLNDQIQQMNVNVVLKGDAEGIFKVVRQQNSIYQTATGRSAFA